MSVAVRFIRLSAAAVAALLSVLLLAGCASATTAGRATTHRAAVMTTAAVTARHTYDPWTSSGELTVPVSRTVSGSCFTASIAAPGAATYRCMAGNLILDPCFAHGTSRTLACVATPGADAVLLRSTKALPTGPAFTARIWTIRLSTGLTCTAATGTVPQVRGVDLDYVCPGGVSAAPTGTRSRLVGAVYAAANARTLRHATVTALWRAPSAG